MTNNDGYSDEVIADLPCSAILKLARNDEDSSDEEDRIGWSEVQRLLFERDWGPVLALPVTNHDFFLDGAWDDDSAFATWDFRRQHPIDPFRSLLAEAEQEYKEAVWMVEMYLDHISGRAKYRVLKYLRDGVIEPEHCVGEMRLLAVWSRRARERYTRVERLRKARSGWHNLRRQTAVCDG